MISILFSSCTTYFTVTESKVKDTVNTNLKNSIKVDKNSKENSIKELKYFKHVKLNSGYNTLDTVDMKRLYKALKRNITAFTDEKHISDGKVNFASEKVTVENCKITKRQIAKVFFAFNLDNPQVFWLDEPYSFSIYDDSVSLSLYFTMKKAEYKKRLGQLNSVVNSILRGVDKNMNAFERELYIHDYIVKNCKYDKKADNAKDKDPYTIYGCLVNQNAVCMGYTAAFQLLLSYVGIRSITIDGSDTDTGHIWNAVKLGGDWYHTDVTWDDINDISMYDYFNVTTKQLTKTHSIVPMMTEYNDDELFESDGTVKSCNLIIPKCDSLRYNYYVYKGTVMSDIEKNSVSRDLAKTAERGESYFHIYVDPSELDFNTVYNQLFSDEIYSFADYIREANSILGREVLSTSVTVTRKDSLRVMSVRLKYNQ